MQQTHASSKVANSAADTDGSIVGEQVGVACVGCIPRCPQEVYHSCEVHGVAVGLHTKYSLQFSLLSYVLWALMGGPGNDVMFMWNMINTSLIPMSVNTRLHGICFCAYEHAIYIHLCAMLSHAVLSETKGSKAVMKG